MGVRATSGAGRGPRDTLHRVAAGAAALTAGLATALAVGVGPAQAVGLGATATSTTTAVQGATTRLTGLAVTGASAGDTLAVTVATTRGQVKVDTSTGVTLAYGNTAQGSSVAFTGSPAQVNAALAATDLVAPAGSAGQSATVSLTAYQQQAGIVYGAATGHFYEYVPANVSWDAAFTQAGQRSFQGQPGYLVSITSPTENDLVTSRIPGAMNVWIGAHALSGGYAREWQWAAGPEAGQIFSTCSNPTNGCDFATSPGYSDWSSGEPNNWGGSTGVDGEWVAVTNWNSANGLWNDLASATSVSGYVVEYGGTGGSFSGLASASSSVSILGLPGAPTGVSATSGLGQASVSFTAPASNGGSSITGYTVTTSPGGATGTCASSPCTVAGLTGGTSYTFRVTATTAVGTGSASSPSAAVTIGYAPATPTGGTGTPLVGQAFSGSITSAGYPTPTYAVTAGALPAGLSLNSATGALSGTPTAVGTWSFTVAATNTYDSASAAFSLTVEALPGAIGGALGDVPVGQAVTATLTSTGTPAPAFAVTAGALPTGLTLSAAGLISGTPTIPGFYSATVTATNAHGSSSVTLTGTVLVAPSAVSGTVPQLMIGSAASATLTAPAYPTPTFAVTAGALPAGLTLSSAGVLSGTPTAAGPWSFEVTATNSQGAVSRTYSGHVGAVPSAIGGTLPSLVWGGPVAALLTSSGYPAPTFAVTAGALPAGLTLDASAGGVVGTPVVAGAYSVTITATNTHGSSSVTFTGTVAAVVPGAPAGLSAVRGDGRATLTFDAPTADGGSTLTGYEVSVDGGAWAPLATTATGTSVTGTVEGLVNGVEVQLRVRGVNAVGAGPASGRVGVLPVAPPPAPVAAPTAVAGVASATVTWTASTERDVTGYTVIAQPGPATCDVAAGQTSCVIGAQAGVPVRFAVVTHSRWGDSAASWLSAAVTPTAPAVQTAPPADAPTTLTTEGGAISTIGAGDTVVVVGTGFAPWSTATVVIYSTPRVLGTVQTDGEGSFRLPVQVPRDLEAGHHTFVAYGVQPSGEDYAMTLPVVLPTDATTLARTGAASRDLAAVTLLLVAAGVALRVCASRVRGRATPCRGGGPVG